MSSPGVYSTNERRARAFVFFTMHAPDYAFGVIMALLVSIVITIVLFDRLSRPASSVSYTHLTLPTILLV